MAKFSNPVSFTAQFGINPRLLETAGALDPLLNVDTKLFIDPLLLDESGVPEIKAHARSHLKVYFETVLSY